MTPIAAIQFASDVLDWMTRDPDRLVAFLTATGISTDTLRRGAADPGTALAIVDHLMTDDRLLLAACTALDTSPETPSRAQTALGGGSGPNWT